MKTKKERRVTTQTSDFHCFRCRVLVVRREAVITGTVTTICNAEQAIHNYTLHTGKQVMSIFQYCNAPSQLITPAQLHSHTTDKRSFKRHPLDVDPVRSACATLAGYPQMRPQPSPSMLIDEKGILRFPSIADVELHAEDSFSRIGQHLTTIYQRFIRYC